MDVVLPCIISNLGLANIDSTTTTSKRLVEPPMSCQTDSGICHGDSSSRVNLPRVHIPSNPELEVDGFQVRGINIDKIGKHAMELSTSRTACND